MFKYLQWPISRRDRHPLLLEHSLHDSQTMRGLGNLVSLSFSLSHPPLAKIAFPLQIYY